MPTSSVGRANSGAASPPGSATGVGGRPRTAASGITLLEMLVVVAIIGVVAGLSYPAISAGLDSVRMVSTTDSIAAMLNGAVTRAQRRQQAIELVVSFKENSLTLYSNEPGFTREFRLPTGLAIEAVLPAIEDPSGAPRHFIFLPGAAVPGIGIQITNRRDAHRLVKLDPMTGFPRVESVNTK